MIKFTVGFLFSLIVYLYFIFNKDDDIIDRIKNRKPTPEEGLRRTLYVISRLFSALLGGGVLGINIAKYFLFPYKIIDYNNFSNNNKDLLAITFIIIMFVFLRCVQNLIRYAQGRNPRPILDIQTMVRNIRK